jgi:hypothetical protein
MGKKAIFIEIMSLVLVSALAGCGEVKDSSSSSSSEASSSSEGTSQSAVSSKPSSQVGGATEYVFEAEYCPGIEDLEGKGYSGTATGTSMILQDSKGTLGASNRYYVSFLYVAGISLDFTINSSAAVSNATFVFRITAEFMNIVLSPSNYTVSVNGASLNYDDITLNTGTHSADTAPFSDHVLTTELSLKSGANTVKLMTSNNTPMIGTMSATAPMIDCFKITTTATLTWTPKTSNIES